MSRTFLEKQAVLIETTQGWLSDIFGSTDIQDVFYAFNIWPMCRIHRFAMAPL